MKLSAFLLIILPVLSGCAWLSLGDKSEKAKPKELQSIQTEVDVRKIWSRNIGKGTKDKAIRLVPALSDDRVFAASANGNIAALRISDGREIWRARVEDFYSDEDIRNAFSDEVDIVTGGVGVGSDLVAMGTAAGEILALNKSDGTFAWRSRTTSELLAPPQIDRNIVVVHTIDGKVAAYDTGNGERNWLYSTTIPSLTLRGTATPIITNDFVVAGFSSGRFALIDRTRGLAGLERMAGVAQGRSDLERLVDIDGNMIMIGTHLFLIGYQGSLIAYNTSNGIVEWNREASSVVGLGSGFGNIYVAYADSRLGAVDVDDGKDVWETDALLHRSITTPVAAGSYIVVGDFKGYLHVIAQSDGRFVGRESIGGDGIYSPAVTDGNRVYIMDNSGTLSLFELR